MLLLFCFLLQERNVMNKAELSQQKSAKASSRIFIFCTLGGTNGSKFTVLGTFGIF